MLYKEIYIYIYICIIHYYFGDFAVLSDFTFVFAEILKFGAGKLNSCHNTNKIKNIKLFIHVAIFKINS